jgi:formiminotetrahydrofolate cyclodeaminase
MLVDASVRELLDAFASSDPTPGGGSAAALASGIGAALLTMVAGLPKTRNSTDEDRTALDRAADALASIRRQLTDAVDADTSAYNRVVSAYKMARATDAEKAARKQAIQDGLRAATDVPLSVVRLTAEALDAASEVAAHGHRGASSDVGVAIALLRAGLQGARLNVEINLGSIDDAGYKQSVEDELERTIGAARATADAAEQALSG